MTFRFIRRARTTDVLHLFHHLSMALRAGVPLTEALRVFEEDAPRRKRRLLRHLRIAMQTGHSFAHALETAPQSFPAIAIHLARTGELGGTLQQSLAEISQYLRKSHDLRRRIRGALLYPSFVLIAIAILGLSMGTLVLPELIPLLESLDIDLPLGPRILLALANFFEKHGVAFSIGTIIAIAVAFITLRLPQSRPITHRIILHLPYVSSVVSKATVAQAMGTLCTLLRSGIPITEALRATSDVTRNEVFRRALLRSIPIVERGHPLHQGLAAGGVFPTMALHFVIMGEKTGTLAETLEHLTTFYEAEVEYAVKDLTTALEPVLLIVIGLVVGATILSIITPIYDITSNIR